MTMTTISRSLPGIKQRTQQLLALSFILVLAACGGGGGDTPPNDDEVNPQSPLAANPGSGECNAASQKQWAYDSMLDFYLFYDQVPVVDPQSFDSADDLVRSVRFQERDPFSQVIDAERSDLASVQGREFGLGYRFKYDSQGDAKIATIMLDSPFGRAGIERGDTILSVNGVNWAEGDFFTDFSDRIIGTPENPATSSWQFQKRGTGEIVSLSFTASEFRINTVLLQEAFVNEAFSGKTGYLAFNRFLETSERELNNAFNDFREREITELVLDLRYNGGGRVSIAQQLASLIAGSSNAGQVIYNYRFNDKYPDENYSLLFQDELLMLGLTRLVVLTTDSTASASEIVIAGLQPYMEVVTIGSATSGKPYIQRAVDQCGERLAVIQAEGFNLAGNSVFGGVLPTCYAEDDLSTGFGISSDDNKLEGMLRAGLDYIVFGTCASAPAVVATRLSLSKESMGRHEEIGQGVSTTDGAWLD